MEDDSASPSVSRISFLKKLGALAVGGIGVAALGTSTKAHANPLTWVEYTCCPTQNCLIYCESHGLGNWGNWCTAGGSCGNDYNYCACFSSYHTCYSYRSPSC